MSRITRLLGAAFALALVLGACSDDGGGGGDAGPDSGSGDAGGGESCGADVCLEGLAYAPSEVTVAAGDPVAWSNVDGTDHTVTADDGAFDSGEFGDGDDFEETFDEAGEFAYHCEIHPDMTGTITVE